MPRMTTIAAASCSSVHPATEDREPGEDVKNGRAKQQDSRDEPEYTDNNWFVKLTIRQQKVAVTDENIANFLPEAAFIGPR